MGSNTPGPLGLYKPDPREVGYTQEICDSFDAINSWAAGIEAGTIPVPPPPPTAAPEYTGGGGIIDLSGSTCWFMNPGAAISVTGITAGLDGERKCLFFAPGGNVSMVNSDPTANLTAEGLGFVSQKNMNSIGSPALQPIEYLELLYRTGVGWLQVNGSFGMGHYTAVQGANFIPGWPAAGATANVSAAIFVPLTATAVRVNVFNTITSPGVGSISTILSRVGLAFTELVAFDDGVNSIGLAGSGVVALDENAQFNVQNTLTGGTGLSFGFLVGWYS